MKIYIVYGTTQIRNIEGEYTGKTSVYISSSFKTEKEAKKEIKKLNSIINNFDNEEYYYQESELI